jgi:hypothetical protein
MASKTLPRDPALTRRRRAGQRDKVPARVIAVAAHLVERLANAAVEDLCIRYDMGILVRRVRSDLSSDMAALSVAHLARALGVHRSRLDRYAKVAAAVAPRDFGALIRLRTTLGLPLTWSHIERLARVRDVALRQNLAREATSGQLSIRALSMRVRALAH